MGDLSLALLGPPEIRHADQVLLFSTRKELALLIYLAVEGRVHLRKKLAEQFWPEGDAMHGRAALRITLLHLRHLLGEGVAADSHLLITRDTLGLDLTSALTLDLHPLYKAWSIVHTSARTNLSLPEEARRTVLAQLQRATSLPRGAFLEDFSLRDVPTFDDWVRLQREYWHVRMNEIFDYLSNWQFEAGELTEALATVSRWLVLDPLHEDAYQRLMRLHFAIGDRATALHTYDTCRAMLATHMQIEPTPETMALASHMRAVAPPRRKEMPQPEITPSPVALLDGPLLGRTAELSALIKIYHATQRGQTQVVLLEGELGIGKTRLATEFLAWAELEGADVLRGQAFETGGQLPYQPLIEALRPRIERENAPDDLLSDMWLAELLHLLPELGDRYPDLPASEETQVVARNRLFEAVARLGQALAARRPLVLFIDDVQWADAASLDVLHYLARRFAESQTPALLLLTLRLEAREVKPALVEWRSGLERAALLTRLQLGPLTSTDILHLLQVLGGKGGKRAADLERFGQWLFTETEGQPFYVMETLKVLLERGVLAVHAQEKGGWIINFTSALEHETVVRGFFPPSVREVIVARLDRLTPHAFALLVAGAILGQRITFEHLRQVANLAEQDELPALDEVLDSHLLQESEHEGWTIGHLPAVYYVFAHAMIRAVVYAEAGEARRSIFHRRALEVLQATAAPAAELAYHALATGQAEPAFRWSLAAGDEAMRVVAVRDAISFYEQAQHLMTECWHGLNLGATLPARSIEHLYTHLGQAHELNAEWEKARSVYSLLLAYAQTSSLPALESTALKCLATLTAQ